jgi:dolichol-phosphate mannosyltransferase
VSRVRAGDVDAIAVVDDGSTDGTAQEAEARGATVIRHPRRLGAGAAIRSAIRHAQAHGFGVLVVMAGNDKDCPEEIPRLLEPIVHGDCDFVQGSRYSHGGAFANMPLHRRVATQYVHPLLFSIAARQRVTDSTNGFRAFRVAIAGDPRLDIEQAWLNRYELEPYLFLKAIRLGYRVREVPVTKRYPAPGQRYTRMTPVVGWWSILKPILFVGFGWRR